jgi:hypothetical protein
VSQEGFFAGSRLLPYEACNCESSRRVHRTVPPYIRYKAGVRRASVYRLKSPLSRIFFWVLFYSVLLHISPFDSPNAIDFGDLSQPSRAGLTPWCLHFGTETPHWSKARIGFCDILPLNKKPGYGQIPVRGNVKRIRDVTGFTNPAC